MCPYQSFLFGRFQGNLWVINDLATVQVFQSYLLVNPFPPVLCRVSLCSTETQMPTEVNSTHEMLIQHIKDESIQLINSPIVCAVLALDSWNYSFGEQAQQPNIHKIV